jgi:hypothetical protein
MRRGWVLWAVSLAGLALPAVGTAQDEKSAGQPGQGVPAGFRSFIVVDDRFPPKVDPATKGTTRDPRDRTAKMHDLVVEQGLNPVALVFTRTDPDKAVGSAAARLAQGLDPLVQKYRANNFGAAVTFLKLVREYPQDDRRQPNGVFIREQVADAIRGLANQLKTPRVVFGLAAENSEQIAAWGVANDDETVVVLYARMRVVNRWSFKFGSPPTDEQVKPILDAAEKLASGK